MTWPDEFGRLLAVFLAILLNFTFQGAHCDLLVSPAGPSLVNALAGSNVTLAVSFSGAPDPAVTWSMGDLPVVTWTINSGAPPDIADSRRKVLKMEPNGSLTLVNVPLHGYNSNYTILMTKSGLGKSSTTFTLKVFDHIQNVTLSTKPDFAREGTDRFTLQYSMLRGVVEQQKWFFNGVEIKSNSRYSVEERSLVILRPTRSDTGEYTVLLTNPFSSVTTHMNVTVMYGPDEPVLEARPAQPFYVSGESLSVSCRAEGYPPPTAEWIFGDQTLPDSPEGVLNLKYVQTSQGGVYTCTLLNVQTREQRQKSITLNVYERPPGNPMCSVQTVNNLDLRYNCRWFGGTPQAQLSFPALSNTSSGAGNFSLNFNASASDNLNGKTVTCMADHPIEQNNCSITASSPMKFVPTVRTTDSGDRIVVTIHCVSEASPKAVVSWSKGSEAVTSGTTYQISSNTTQLEIRDYNISNFRQNYTCTCRNPLGSQSREIQLKGPTISNSRLLPNHNGTIVRLIWEVPSTAVVTGFDIQLKGPDLLSKHRNGTRTTGSSKRFRTIQRKLGHDRRTDIFFLDPRLTYRFRVIPKAHATVGEPSEVNRIGPGEGLSGPAIAGIAAGIPCSLLFLVLLGCFIYFCVSCIKKKNKSRQARYPVSRAVDKAVTAQTETTPHNLLKGGLRALPDYNPFKQTPSERSVPLPRFVPPPPVRVATVV